MSGNLPAVPGRRPQAARMPGQLDDPEWIMVGVAVDNGRKRIYASRDLPNAWFGIDDINYVSEHKITSIMRHMLIVTEDSYPQCLARIQEIWDNHDREAARAAEIEASHGKKDDWVRIGSTEDGAQLSVAPAGTPPPTDAEVDAIVQRALPPGKALPTCGDPDCYREDHQRSLRDPMAVRHSDPDYRPDC